MSAVLERCRLSGIRLWMEGPDLRYDAPKDALTPDLIADLKAHKPAILAALAPLSPAAEARRQKVLAMLGDGGTRYAALVEDPNSDPVILALATPDGTCEISIPSAQYDAFRILTLVEKWEREDADVTPKIGGVPL